MKKQGFTLIELMVVIVIMGILAAVAVPKLFGMIAKSKASEADWLLRSGRTQDLCLVRIRQLHLHKHCIHSGLDCFGKDYPE